jgi:23S rRNA-intervening sequence protein
LEYHLLLAKDLKLIKPKDHTELSQRATELKRMLTGLLQKLAAESFRHKRTAPLLSAVRAQKLISSILG